MQRHLGEKKKYVKIGQKLIDKNTHTQFYFVEGHTTAGGDWEAARRDEFLLLFGIFSSKLGFFFETEGILLLFKGGAVRDSFVLLLAGTIDETKSFEGLELKFV